MANSDAQSISNNKKQALLRQRPQEEISSRFLLKLLTVNMELVLPGCVHFRKHLQRI